MDSLPNKVVKPSKKLKMILHGLLDLAIMMGIDINQNFFKNMSFLKTCKILKKLCKRIHIKIKQLSNNVYNPVPIENKV